MKKLFFTMVAMITTVMSYAQLSLKELPDTVLVNSILESYLPPHDSGKTILLYEELLKRYPSGIKNGGPLVSSLGIVMAEHEDWVFLSNMAACYLKLGQTQKAIKLYERAIKCCDKEHLIFRDWNELSKAYERERKFKKAVRCGIIHMNTELSRFSRENPSLRALDGIRMMQLCEQVGETDWSCTFAHIAATDVIASSKKGNASLLIDQLLTIHRTLCRLSSDFPYSIRSNVNEKIDTVSCRSYLDEAMRLTSFLDEKQVVSKRYQIYVEHARELIDAWTPEVVSTTGVIMEESAPKAKVYCDKAIQLNPDDLEARNIIGLAYLHRGKEYYDEAIKIWEEMKGLYKGPSKLHNTEFYNDLIQTDLYKELRHFKLIEK